MPQLAPVSRSTRSSSRSADPARTLPSSTSRPAASRCSAPVCRATGASPRSASTSAPQASPDRRARALARAPPGRPRRRCRCCRRARPVRCPTPRCGRARPTCRASAACSASVTSSARTPPRSRPGTGHRSRAASDRGPVAARRARARAPDRHRRPVGRHRRRSHRRRRGARPTGSRRPQRHRVRRRRPAVAAAPDHDDGPAGPREGPDPRDARAQTPRRHPARGA